MKKVYDKPIAKVDMYPNLEVMRQSVSQEVRDVLDETINTTDISALKKEETIKEH